MNDRPHIPEKIKREVRQRCGFGCVFCGCPIYEYDHLIEWSKTHHHQAGELTLLCSQHHAEKTRKLLPHNKVKAANDEPFNITAGASSPQSLYYDGSEFKLKLGNSVSTFTGLESGQSFSPFAIDGQPVVSFTNDEGNILLNVEFRNELGDVILSINNSELVYSSGLWDVEWVGQTLTIRGGLRRILLQLTFSPPCMVSIDRGSLHYNGIEIEVGSDYVFCLNNYSYFSDCAVHGAGYGFALGDPVPHAPCGIVFSEIDRPVTDRDEAKRYMKQSLKKMREEKSERRIQEKNLQPISTLGKLLFGGSTNV